MLVHAFLANSPLPFRVFECEKARAMKWYCKTDDDERGPFSFKDLTQMVRDGLVGEADLIRPDYKPDWQRAETVPGLFYMSKKASVVEAEPVCEASDARDSDFFSLDDMPADELESANAPPVVPEEKHFSPFRWLQRIRLGPQRPSRQETAGGDLPIDDSESDELLPVGGPDLSSTWTDTVAAALNRMDERAAKSGFNRSPAATDDDAYAERWWQKSAGPWEFLFVALSVSLITANAYAYWWYQTRILLPREEHAKPIEYDKFPIVGDVTAFEYGILWIDSCLLAGLLIFLGFKLIRWGKKTKSFLPRKSAPATV